MSVTTGVINADAVLKAARAVADLSATQKNEYRLARKVYLLVTKLLIGWNEKDIEDLLSVTTLEKSLQASQRQMSTFTANVDSAFKILDKGIRGGENFPLGDEMAQIATLQTKTATVALGCLRTFRDTHANLLPSKEPPSQPAPKWFPKAGAAGAGLNRRTGAAIKAQHFAQGDGGAAASGGAGKRTSVADLHARLSQGGGGGEGGQEGPPVVKRRGAIALPAGARVDVAKPGKQANDRELAYYMGEGVADAILRENIDLVTITTFNFPQFKTGLDGEVEDLVLKEYVPRQDALRRVLQFAKSAPLRAQERGTKKPGVVGGQRLLGLTTAGLGQSGEAMPALSEEHQRRLVYFCMYFKSPARATLYEVCPAWQ